MILIDSPAAELETTLPLAGVQDVTVLSVLHAATSIRHQLTETLSENRLVALTHVDQLFDSSALLEPLVAAAAPIGFIGTSAYVPGGVEVATDDAIKSLFELTDRA